MGPTSPSTRLRAAAKSPELSRGTPSALSGRERKHAEFIRRISSDHPEYGGDRMVLEGAKFGIEHSTASGTVPVGYRVATTNLRGRDQCLRQNCGSSGKWGGGTWFGAFRIPNLVPRSLVNIVGCSSRGRGNCGKLRAISNWASKPVIRSFPSAVRTVEKQLRALASSPPELLVFPRFA